MSNRMNPQQAARALAVRAALARACNPGVFKTAHVHKAAGSLNADLGWQEQRQKLPGCAIGFTDPYLKWQLTHRGYSRYFKWIINRWWLRKPRGRQRRRQRRKLQPHVVWTCGWLAIIHWNKHKGD